MTYTPEITTKLLADYANNVPVEQIAEELNVGKRSVIAKLSSLGVYKKQVYTTKQGTAPIKKEEYIQRIADHLNVEVESLESLEKANKAILALLDSVLST